MPSSASEDEEGTLFDSEVPDAGSAPSAMLPAVGGQAAQAAPTVGNPTAVLSFKFHGCNYHRGC